MNKFRIDTYIDGCNLTITLLDGNSDFYQVLCNTFTGEVSNIVRFSGSFTYNLTSDGIYKFYIVRDPNASLNRNVLTINSKGYTPSDLIDAIESGMIGFDAEVDYEEIFCDCKLRECLAKLQKKVFFEQLKNCGKSRTGGSCQSTLDDLKSQRNFLFIAHWLIEHLAMGDKSSSIRKIYEGLAKCGSICGDLLHSVNCGCNG